MKSQGKAKIPKCVRTFAIPLTIFFGVSVAIISKITFQQVAKGTKGDEHEFKKPLLQTAAMNIGMMLALVVYGFQFLFAKEKPTTPSVKGILFILFPAFLDTLATTLQYIALLYLDASVWQMFRGSLVLFSWILSITVLKRKNYLYMIFSIFLILVGLTIVGCSIYLSNKNSNKPSFHKSSSFHDMCLGIILILGGQFVQATLIVVEDHLLHNVQVTSEFIVGFKGLWGTIISCLIVLPIAQHVPGSNEGLHEDSLDSFQMMKNSLAIVLLLIFYIILICAFNIYGMYVIDVTDAVVRTIVEGLRALAIWIVDIIIYYSIYFIGQEDSPSFGENVTIWSILELIGFLLLFIGTLTYKNVIKLPFFKYPSAEPSEDRNITGSTLLEKDIDDIE